MNPQTPKEFILEAFADPASVRDVVKGMLSMLFERRWDPMTLRGLNKCTGILHTIFFHRFFPPVAPRSREVLDITLPYAADAELDTMIEKRADELAQRLDAERIHNSSGGSNIGRTTALGAGLGALRAGGGGGGGGGAAAGRGGKGGDGRGTVTVQFFEKRRRKAWYGAGRDEEVCWESWTVRVTVAEPRTETGGSFCFLSLSLFS